MKTIVLIYMIRKRGNIIFTVKIAHFTGKIKDEKHYQYFKLLKGDKKMLTTKIIKDELLKDENIEIEINHYGGLEIYHNGVYTDMIITDGESFNDEIATVTFNNGKNELSIALPILDDIIGSLYNRIDY